MAARARGEVISRKPFRFRLCWHIEVLVFGQCTPFPKHWSIPSGKIIRRPVSLIFRWQFRIIISRHYIKGHRYLFYTGPYSGANNRNLLYSNIHGSKRSATIVDQHLYLHALCPGSLTYSSNGLISILGLRVLKSHCA